MYILGFDIGGTKCAVVLSLLMSVFIFKERTTAKGIMGVTLSIISMILINLFAPH